MKIKMVDFNKLLKKQEYSEKYEEKNPLITISLDCLFGQCESCKYSHESPNIECECISH